jgi:hypothetical protein
MNLQPWIKNTKHYFIATESGDLLFNKNTEQKCADATEDQAYF